jgi:hypothetical protein
MNIANRTNLPLSDFTIYTSLPPSLSRTMGGRDLGEGYQRSCIASWRSLGTKVVSLNSQAEISDLANKGYDIEFVQIDGQRPRIVDFLDAIKASGQKIAAIVNADCILIATTATIDAAIRSAASGMVIFERLNVSAETLCPTGESCRGFDLFLFGTEPLDRLILDEKLMIGSPWWDYWFPLAYGEAGGKLASLHGPALLHLDHPLGYGSKSWEDNARRLHSYLAKRKLVSGLDPGSDLIPSKRQLFNMAGQCFSELQSSDKIIIEDQGSNLNLKMLRNAQIFGNERVHKAIEDAQSRPFTNLYKYVKWWTSKPLATLSIFLGKEFSARMHRRAAKNAPLTRNMAL